MPWQSSRGIEPSSGIGDHYQESSLNSRLWRLGDWVSGVLTSELLCRPGRDRGVGAEEELSIYLILNLCFPVQALTLSSSGTLRKTLNLPEPLFHLERADVNMYIRDGRKAGRPAVGKADA